MTTKNQSSRPLGKNKILTLDEMAALWAQPRWVVEVKDSDTGDWRRATTDPQTFDACSSFAAGRTKATLWHTGHRGRSYSLQPRGWVRVVALVTGRESEAHRRSDGTLGFYRRENVRTVPCAVCDKIRRCA